MTKSIVFLICAPAARRLEIDAGVIERTSDVPLNEDKIPEEGRSLLG